MEIFKKRVLSNNILRVLRIKSFFLMMLSEFFSQVAFNMQHFVLIFIIYGFTHSNTAVSGMILSFMIPAVLFSVISGIYVDRWNKKKVLLFVHLIRAALLLPFLIPNLHLGLIYALTFLIAVVTQFFIPAEYSIIPQLVPKKLLVSANAVFSFGIFAIMLIGYILSGPALLLLGRTYTIILLIFLFVVSAFIVAGIKLTDRKKEVIPKNTFTPQRNYSFTKEASEIFIFIRKAKKVMHAFFMITIAQSVIFMFAVLAPGYVTTILEAPLESVSVILIAPAGLGFGIGAFILGSMGRRIKQRISAIGFMVVGIVFILMPLASRVTSYGFVLSLNSFLPSIMYVNILHIIVLMAFIMGFGISLVSIPSNSTIQIETSQEMRGRMYGLLSALTGAVSFLPVILAGSLADIFGVGAIITSVGIIMAVLSACYLFLIKL
ncbi:MAG: MFS transporter [Candidatus Levybacteria bacterium]|nr:MFS transporter [Candidatus Levybacteria bacterium]MDZ4228332.1 MFS transporter [Candidatus Levybacteria bacterium]